MDKRKKVYLLLFFGVYIFIHLAIINAYSINWDFHHVFFAGLYHTRHPVGPELVKHIPFTDPDPKRMVETPFGPFQSFFPALTYSWFYERLKLLPFDSAFSLPAVVSGFLGVMIVFFFAVQALTLPEAIAAAVFLALYPRFWGDMHTNVKDVPTAAFYALSIFLAWRVVNFRRPKDVILAAIAFGITFNFKVNAIFIPVIVAGWVLYVLTTKAKRHLAVPLHSVRSVFVPLGMYAIWSAFALIAIWSVFWNHPFDHLRYLIWFFQNNTVNLEALLNGAWYCSGQNIPWYYPFWYLAIVTPLPVLIFFLTGFIIHLKNSILRKKPISALLLLWFIVPIVRFLSPKVGVLDGIRHFEEVEYPLVLIAGSGFIHGIHIINNLTVKQSNNLHTNKVTVGLTGLLVLYLIGNILLYHPYQLSYFNELVGGLPGAMSKYDIDYWGISQKNAVEWVNTNAPEGSIIHIAMSADVAAKYLRPDLLPKLNTTGFDGADYVIVLNRQSFFYRYFYVWEYFLRRKPVYTVQRLGTPLSWVFDNNNPAGPRQKQWWKGESPCIQKYWITGE